MTKRILALLAVLALALPGWGEPRYTTISATNVAASTTLTGGQVKRVTLYNAGTKTVYFRLFTDADVTGSATTSSAALVAGASLGFTLVENDTESYVGSTKARRYASISTITGGSDTTTVYVYFK